MPTYIVVFMFHKISGKLTQNIIKWMSCNNYNKIIFDSDSIAVNLLTQSTQFS